MPNPGNHRRTMDDWRIVALETYALANPVLMEIRDHHSRHYFLSAGGERYVISQSPLQPDRMAKSYQFELIGRLYTNGFRTVSLPVRAVNGSYCHLRCGSWWVLKRHVHCDSRVSWSDAAVATEAARVLAELHRCGRDYPQSLVHESNRSDLGAFYLPLIRWPDRSEEIARSFPWHELDSEDASFVRSHLARIQRETDDIRSWCVSARALSITHQDYRPANLCFAGESIREVWDFDMAVIDCCVSDVAFAALQFGGRECLFPDVSLELAGAFVREYTTRSGIPELRDELRILRWFATVSVLRRLLLNYHVAERIQLLRLVTDGVDPLGVMRKGRHG